MEPKQTGTNADATVQMTKEEIRQRLELNPLAVDSGNKSLQSILKVLPFPTAKKITIETCDDPDDQQAKVNVHQLLDLQEGAFYIQQIKSEIMRVKRTWFINLSELIFCDSMMLGYCIIWHTICKQYGGRMVFIVKMNSGVHEKFQLSRLSEICNVELV
jgi:anti-anti-sigma regulatory factor